MASRTDIQGLTVWGDGFSAQARQYLGHPGYHLALHIRDECPRSQDGIPELDPADVDRLRALLDAIDAHRRSSAEAAIKIAEEREPDAWDNGQTNWDAAIAAGYTADDINLSAVIANGPSIWTGFPEPTLWHRALDHFHLRFGIPTEVLAPFDPSEFDTSVALLDAIKALADGSRS